jgi:hypothetical protein
MGGGGCSVSMELIGPPMVGSRRACVLCPFVSSIIQVVCRPANVIVEA